MYPMDEGDRFFSVLPTNHAIDFMCGFLLPLLMGGAVVHQRTLRSEFLASTMQRYGVTQIALVPRLLKAMKEKIEENLDDLPKWQRAVVDGLIEANPAEWERFCDGDAKVAGFFVGQVMKATQGKADGKAVTALLNARRG